jgi:tricorn protease
MRHTAAITVCLFTATLAGAPLSAQETFRPSAPRHETGAASRPAKAAIPAELPAVAFPQYPAISPDGAAIVFTYAGDLWSVPSSGGVAERLTAHPSDEGRSAFSPEGSLLAFESERDGPRNIYIMPLTSAGGSSGALAGGTVRRITISDRAQALSGFSADGKHVYFASNHEPSIHRATRMYRAGVEAPDGGGAPMERLTDAYGAAPRPAPDGSAILFYRGRYDTTRTKYAGSANTDVYRLDLGTSSFTRLTSDPHNDGDAFPLPDGSVVFVSARDGENNLWRLKPGANDGDKSALTQLTRFAPAKGDATIAHGVRDLNVAPGGTTAVFAVWDTLYTLDLKATGAEPRAVPVAAGGDFAQLDFQRTNLSRQVTDAALSPDGKTLAVIARGELFVRSTEKDRPTRRVSGPGSLGAQRIRDLAWSPDGRILYFASDATGVSGIYAATVVLAREDLASEDKPERVPEARPEKPEPPAPDPTAPKADPTPDGDAGAAGESKNDPARSRPGPGSSGSPAPKPAAGKKPDHGKRWSESITFTVKPIAVSEAEQRAPLPSPDGKRLLITRGLGDLVMLELADGLPKKDAQERAILSSWDSPTALWAADSRHVIYEVQDFNYNTDIWLVDALADSSSDEARPVNLTRHPDNDHAARLSADGKVLYFLSDRDASANGQDDVFAVNLDRKLDGLRPYELAEYYKEAADKAKKRRPLGAPATPVASGSGRGGRGSDAKPADDAKGDEAKADDTKPDAKPESKPDAKKDPAPSPEHPLTFDAADAYLRVRKVISGLGDISGLEITPGAERVIFPASIDGNAALFSTDHLGKDRKTVFGGPGGNLQASLTGERILFTSGGPAARGDTPAEDRPRRGPGGEAYLGRPGGGGGGGPSAGGGESGGGAGGGGAEKLAIDAPVTIDIAAQQRQKFREAARLMGQHFYHPTLKGLDWPRLMERYESLIVRTRTDPEFNRVFSNLLGELEGSHMGISGGRDTAGTPQPIGYLGIDAERTPGGFRITRIVPNSPADAKSTRLSPGETIVSINGKPVAPAPDQAPATDLAAAMAGTAGQETLLELRPSGAGKPARFVLITPMSSATDTSLRYQDEVRRNAALVDKLSAGKLGYLHIRSMDMASVRDYERDLFAAADGKLGLLIDVRDNGGGSTADILLSSLTAPRHAYTAARGVDLRSLPKDAYPRDRRLIYAYNRAISVLCNQNSYSNAEIFSHSIKTIGRGTLVGTQTFGAVISTGAHALIDGTNLRTPFRGWYLPDGTDMENHGAEPDIAVPQSPEDECAGKDRQLEKAVEELLTRAKLP